MIYLLLFIRMSVWHIYLALMYLDWGSSIERFDYKIYIIFLIMNIRLSLSCDLFSPVLTKTWYYYPLRCLFNCVCVCVRACVCVMQLHVGRSSSTSAPTTCLMGGILRMEKTTVPILSTFMDAANWRERERRSDTVQVVVCLTSISITMCLYFTCLSSSHLFSFFLSDCLSLAVFLWVSVTSPFCALTCPSLTCLSLTCLSVSHLSVSRMPFSHLSVSQMPLSRLSVCQVRWCCGCRFCSGRWSRCLRVPWHHCGSKSRRRRRAAPWITASRGSPPTHETSLLSAGNCLRERDRCITVCVSERERERGNCATEWERERQLHKHLFLLTLPVSPPVCLATCWSLFLLFACLTICLSLLSAHLTTWLSPFYLPLTTCLSLLPLPVSSPVCLFSVFLSHPLSVSLPGPIY